jgi:hypothetical protein
MVRGGRQVVVVVVACAGVLAGCRADPAAAPQPIHDTDAGATAASVSADSVPLSVLSGAVPACPAGSAHPNVCCRSGPDEATVCSERAVSPFEPCDSASLTFPDPRTCCPLEGSGACAPLSDGGEPGEAGSHSACSFPCGPDGYPPSKLSDDGGFSSCADIGPTGGSCVYCCEGLGCPSNVCHCPAIPVNAPPDAASCRCGPQCDACPAGWDSSFGVPDLCCRTLAEGRECFSQAGTIEPLYTFATCPFSFGATGVRSCNCSHRASDGHVYRITCDASQTPPCVCVRDGQVTAKLDSFGCPSSGFATPMPGPASIGAQNAAIASLNAACGFPNGP